MKAERNPAAIPRSPDMSRPLQNRVDPFGAFHAVAARGALMGNRGGRIHRDDRTLGPRRWTNKHWLICRCEFNERRREVWVGNIPNFSFSTNRPHSRQAIVPVTNAGAMPGTRS
jgi:hypothetical protein